MRRCIAILLLSAPLAAQNYASYSNRPVARTSYLRHQFNPSKNAYMDSRLVGYWRLNEGAGTVAYDSSGKGNAGNWAGTKSGTAGYFTQGSAQAWTAKLDGSTNIISIPNTSSVNFNGPLTAISIFKVSSTVSGDEGLISQGWDGSTDRFFMRLGSSTSVYFGNYSSSNGSKQASATVSSLVGSGLHCMAGSYDGTAYNVYFDGALAATTASTAAPRSSGVNIGIGAMNNTTPGVTTYFKGTEAEVRLYNTYLTPEEIQTICGWYTTHSGS